MSRHAPAVEYRLRGVLTGGGWAAGSEEQRPAGARWRRRPRAGAPIAPEWSVVFVPCGSLGYTVDPSH